MRDKPIVLGHANCWDGAVSMWLMSKAYPSARFLPVQYGQELPFVEGAHLIMVDFCYKRQDLIKLAKQAAHTLVIDHHKTSMEDVAHIEEEANVQAIFDMKKSGARLTWEYLYTKQLLPDRWMAAYTKEEPPWLVRYSEDRDLWKWALPNSHEINAALRSYPMTFERLDVMSHIDPIKELVREGQAILRREQQIVDAHVHFAKEIELGGIKGLAVNATVMSSEIGHELAKKSPTTFGATWFIRSDGMEVWSLRSLEGGTDVGELAKSLGGGGHRAASGFEVKKP